MNRAEKHILFLKVKRNSATISQTISKLNVVFMSSAC